MDVMNLYQASAFQVSLDLFFYQEGDYIVAFCPALDLAGHGTDEQRAKDSFDVNLRIFLEETSRKRTLPAVLLDLGWELQKFPRLKAKPSVKYDIPTEILRKQQTPVSIPL